MFWMLQGLFRKKQRVFSSCVTHASPKNYNISVYAGTQLFFVDVLIPMSPSVDCLHTDSRTSRRPMGSKGMMNDTSNSTDILRLMTSVQLQHTSDVLVLDWHLQLHATLGSALNTFLWAIVLVFTSGGTLIAAAFSHAPCVCTAALAWLVNRYRQPAREGA